MDKSKKTSEYKLSKLVAYENKKEKDSSKRTALRSLHYEYYLTSLKFTRRWLLNVLSICECSAPIYSYILVQLQSNLD